MFWSTGGGLDGGALDAQEPVSVADADEVGGDGALGGVLGAHCRSKERTRGLRGGWSMTRNVGEVRWSPSGTPDGPTAQRRKLTSVSAGQCLGGAPRRNRTADTILTMDVLCRLS
jgi:hypothetical protein